MSNCRLHRSRAYAALLLFVLLVFPACGSQQAGPDQDQNAPQAAQNSAQKPTQAEASKGKKEEPAKPEARPEKPKKQAEKSGKDSGTTVEAVLPEDVLSEEELEKGAPEYRDWNAPASEDYSPDTAKFFVTSNSSTGAIPAVTPFNFGRDPGGPQDKTLSLSVPSLGLEGVRVFNSLSEEGLKKGTVHVPATGFPWQRGANVYIAGHRLGYPNTGSFRVFYDLDLMRPGDEITLTDAAGRTYVYRVSRKLVVGPENVEVMNAVEGKSLVTLQTCTLPDYKKRIVVQGKLIHKSA